MDEQLKFILDRVHQHEQDRTAYKALADEWEQMWRLKPGFVLPLGQSIQKGLEQVITPRPFNVVNLALRLLSSTPKVDVIPDDVNNKESEEYAEQCEKWLTAMWERVNQDQQRNVLGDANWQNLVLGRFVFEVKWIKDNLPKNLKKTVFPILIRTLDPRNVGIVRGPYCTEYAYHRYESSLREVLRRWPSLKEAKSDSILGNMLSNMDEFDHNKEETQVSVIDYWATDPEDGSVWNAVLVEDEYAKEYELTSYPYIPLICGKGDYAVGIGDEYDGLSLLHSINGLWQYECRLESQKATGLMWHFWPEYIVTNENNTPVDDIEIGPGRIAYAPAGTKVEQVSMEPNVPLADAVTQMVVGHMEQSTFPGVMFGQAPADLKAGYGVALLSDAAQGRIKAFQESMEMALSHVHSLVLCLVEKKGGKEGVDIYGVSKVSGDKYRLNLNKKMINGVYANKVSIIPAMPTDDMQRVVQGKQLADSKYISAQTLRDKYLGIKVPTDETRRITLEEAMQSDELRPYRIRRALEEYFGDEAYTIMYGTELMPPPPEGYEWTMNDSGKVTLKKLPKEPPMDPMAMGEPPMPPMPPSGGPMDAGLGLPPAGEPPLPPGGPPIQSPGMAGPMGGGIPPVQTGQLEGEALGMDPSMDPLLFDMMMNTPGNPDEQMNMAAGLPPEGLPY